MNDNENDTKIILNSKNLKLRHNNNNQLNIMHLNIRSLKKNYTELLLQVEALRKEENDIHVIILTETFIIDDITSFPINGYKIYYSNARFNKNDGTLIYIKDNISSETKHTMLTEVTMSKTSIKIFNTTLEIYSTYRPPSTSTETFITDLQKYIEKTSEADIKIIIGDINIDILKQETTSNEYTNSLANLGYTSFINKPTRETTNTSTCIDHCFVKMKTYKKTNTKINAYILQSTLTDHYSQIISLEFQRNESKKVIAKTNRINFNILDEKMEKTNWNEICQINNPKLATTELYKKINNAIAESTTERRINKKNMKIKEWITNGLLKSINKRNKLKYNLRFDSGTEKVNAYKKYRNKLTEIIKATKNNYYKLQLLDSQNNTKKTWEIINDITNAKKK